MYSLYDGSMVIENSSMHTNFLYAFLVTRDGKFIVSCGADKKIKLWDWVKQKLLYTFLGHEGRVESIAFSFDEKLLFSAGLDNKIMVWSMDNWFEVCYLITDFSTRTLTLSDDNDYLIAERKSDQEYKGNREIMFWPLEKNTDGFRINVVMKGANCCYVTPDNMYMAILKKSEVDIWNIQSRTLV